MEKIKIEKDIKVFCVPATSFPAGIADAFEKLHSLIPFSKERNYFGLSRPENSGEIVYRAAAEELDRREAKKLGFDTIVIKEGEYVSLHVKQFRKNPMVIKEAFDQLLTVPNLDPQGYCVEWYHSEKEEVRCMIRLEE